MLNKELTFGEKIKELRLKQGLTQTQVATAVGVSPQAYSRWERDERQPAYGLLAALLSVLGNPEFKIHDQDCQPDPNAGHPLSINLTEYPIRRYSTR